MNRFATRLALALVFFLAFSYSAQARSAHASQFPTNVTPATTIVQFGVHGGNIRPWSVSFTYGGMVTASGIAAKRQHLMDPKSTLQAIYKLARSEKFFSLPAQTNCSGTLPDIGTVYVSLMTTSGTTRVDVHGGCAPGFTQLADTLSQIADIP